MSAPLDPKLKQYQTQVLRRRQSTQLDFPGHVHLETLALCNAACGFCPYPSIERKGERMAWDLIEKIIGDLRDIPAGHPFQISPFKVNEPFLDVRLFDVLALINDRLPHATIALTSNATPLTERTLSRLSTVKQLGYLWLSVNDHRPEEYETAMRLPFDRTLERLRVIHQWKAEGRLPTRVVLSRVGDGSQHDLIFRAWVVQEFPLFESSVFQRGQWLGQAETGPAQAPPDVGCVRWFELSITATGVVAHCCMDGDAAHPIGDVRREHVLAVYNKPEYRRLREATLSRLDVAPCRDCSFL